MSLFLHKFSIDIDYPPNHGAQARSSFIYLKKTRNFSNVHP